MRRQGSEIAVRGPERDRDIVGPDLPASKFAVLFQKRRDLVFAFFGLKRTGAIDEHPARLHEVSRMREQLRLQARERRNVLGAFQKQDIRMTTDRARRRARRIEKHGVECLIGLECQRVGHRGLGGEPQPL